MIKNNIYQRLKDKNWALPPVLGRLYAQRPSSLGERLLVLARTRISGGFMRSSAPDNQADVINDGANVLEQLYPHPERIIAAGLGEGDDFRAAFPRVTYMRIAAGGRLPFADQSFEIENGFLTASLCLGGFLALERRPHLAGALFGLLTMKPHLGLVIPLVLLRTLAWRAVLTAGAVITLLAVVSAVTFDLEVWRDFLLISSAYHTNVLIMFSGFYTFMMGSVFSAVRTFGGGVHWATIIQIAVAIPVAITTMIAYGRTKNRILRVQLIASAAFLLTPYLFIYDMTWNSAVAVWRLLAAGEGARPVPLLYILVWLSPGYIFQASFFGLGLAPLFTGAMFLAALQDIRRERGVGVSQAPRNDLTVD